MTDNVAAAEKDGPLVRTPFIWTLYLLLGLFSFMLSMIGPMVPYLRDEFGIDYTIAGLHQSAFAVGMVGMGLTGGVVIRKLGIAASLWGGMLDMILGLLVMVLAKGPAMTIAGVFVMSLGGTVAMAAIQTSFANGPAAHRGRLLMEGNVSSSINTMLVPVALLVGVRLGLGWRFVFPLMAVALAAIASFGLKATSGHLKTRDEKADAGHGKKLPAPYWRAWAIVFFGVSVEWAISFWCMTYLLGLPGESRALASAGTVALGLSAVVGRFVSSRLGARFSEERRLAAVIVLVALGFPLYWFRPGVAATFIGLSLAGIGSSNFYPLLVAIALKRAPGNAAKASSFIPVASGSAIGLAPFLLGRLGDVLDIRTALLYIPIGLAVMVAMLAADRAAGKKALA